MQEQTSKNNAAERLGLLKPTAYSYVGRNPGLGNNLSDLVLPPPPSAQNTVLAIDEFYSMTAGLSDAHLHDYHQD